MARQYNKVQELLERILERHANGETYREIGYSYGLSKKQIQELVSRENRKQRKIAAGYVLCPKGRPRKTAENTEISKDNEIVELKMQETSIKRGKIHIVVFRMVSRYFGLTSPKVYCQESIVFLVLYLLLLNS